AVPSESLRPITNLTSFFAKSCDNHRNLRSFPTRRSSDLKIAVAALAGTRGRQEPSVTVAAACRGVMAGMLLVEGDLAKTSVALRSEEHTSKLQSPCNLICRLLLEKKKLFGDC